MKNYKKCKMDTTLFWCTSSGEITLVIFSLGFLNTVYFITWVSQLPLLTNQK